MKYLFLFLFSLSLYSDNIAFIGLIDSTWKIVIDKNNKFKIISTLHEPQDFDIDFDKEVLVYVGNDQNIWYKDKEHEKILIKDKKNRYIEPYFIDETNNILLTKQINKNPKNTDIVLYDIRNNFLKEFFQDLSQHLGKSIDENKLYYLNTICLKGCEQDIIELWEKDLNTNKAKQITLTNSYIKDFIISKRSKSLYFLSDMDGSNQIYRLDLKTKHIKKYLDNSFGYKYFDISKSGNFYFIKDNKLFYIKKNGKILKISIPSEIKKIRKLVCD